VRKLGLYLMGALLTWFDTVFRAFDRMKRHTRGAGGPNETEGVGEEVIAVLNTPRKRRVIQ